MSDEDTAASRDAHGGDPTLDRPSPQARELVRATSDLARVVASLLTALYPSAELYRVGAGLERLILDPAPPITAQLRRLLFELVDRPEWRAKHAIAREVGDEQGERLEVLTPVAPEEYRFGARLVGPFPTEQGADEWGADHAVATLSYDTFFTGEVWLCDLFDLPHGA